MRLRKLFAALLTLTLIFGAFAPVSQSQERWRKESTAGRPKARSPVWRPLPELNLRAEPSASGAVLTTIPGGTDVVVVEWSEPGRWSSTPRRSTPTVYPPGSAA